MSSEEKTEDPTDKKMRKAREDGQTLNVPTGNKMVGFFFSLLAIIAITPGTAGYVTGSFDLLGQAGDSRTISAGKAVSDFIVAFLRVMLTMLVISLVMSTLFSALVKRGLSVSFVPVKPKVSRVNPGQNVKTMYAMNEIRSSIFDLLKLLLWLSAFIGVFGPMIPQIVQTMRYDYSRMSEFVIFLFLLLLALLLCAGVVFAAFDFLMEKRSFVQNLKMTKSEVKRERRDQSGDPKIRRWRNEMKRSIMQNTPRGAEHATVVVEGGGRTISVRYDAQQMEMPFVVDNTSKGRQKARRKAETAGAVMIRDPKLSKLLASRAVGDMLLSEEEYRPIVLAMNGREQR